MFKSNAKTNSGGLFGNTSKKNTSSVSMFGGVKVETLNLKTQPLKSQSGTQEKFEPFMSSDKWGHHKGEDYNIKVFCYSSMPKYQRKALRNYTKNL